MELRDPSGIQWNSLGSLKNSSNISGLHLEIAHDSSWISFRTIPADSRFAGFFQDPPGSLGIFGDPRISLKTLPAPFIGPRFLGILRNWDVSVSNDSSGQ